MSYSKNKVTSIQTLIQNFFLERLIQQRGVTSRTIESYRDTFKIYIKYLQETFNISVENIDISDFSQDKVLLFLKYLEENRNNKPITLNNRLSVIHTFMKYVAEQAPEYSNIAKKTIMIPFKKQETKIIEYISKEEFKAMINQCDDSTYLGLRDKVMLMILYNTGIRVSELISLNWKSFKEIENNKSTYLFVTGKGRKERTLPLWKSTTELVKEYVHTYQLQNKTTIFINKNNSALTRSGVRFRIEKLLLMASNECPSLLEKNISVHTFRHSVAMNLLQAGVDISTIAIWLGHNSIETTHKYMVADLEIKRKAMEKAGIIDNSVPKYKPSNDLLEFLSKL